MAKDELTFVEFMTSFRRGDLVSECDQMLGELVDAIHSVGGDGTLTITLPFKTNKAGQIECTPDIKMKKPRRAIGTGIFYASDDGKLTRKDPNQPDMIDELEQRRN